MVQGCHTTPDDIALSLEKMNQIEELDTTAHTMTVQAGVTMREAQDAADEKGLFFPVDIGARGVDPRIGGTGNPNHIDLTLDQMFGWRPPGAAGHRTELPWLYLTGAGTPPGGGLSGVSGRAAATALLHDLDARPSAGARLRSVAGEVGGLWSAMKTYLQRIPNSGLVGFSYHCSFVIVNDCISSVQYIQRA